MPSSENRTADAVTDAQSTGDELLYQSAYTRVTRRHFPDGRSVIQKEFLGAEGAERSRRERRILSRLAGTSGVPELVNAGRTDTAITFEDNGFIPLREAVSPGQLEVAALLEIAIGLAVAITGIHQCGVMHKDICPQNVLLGPDYQPMLVDFDIATSTTEERPAFGHHSKITGTLAYISPEQTGRTGRTVDQRADLYSLGATLYELAVGYPPFREGDLLQLVHDHLATVPISVREINPNVPEALSDIIARLLEKEPDRRYQSASGLAADLLCLKERLAQGESQTFSLGEHDFPIRLSPPSRPVGRETEIQALRTAFETALRSKQHTVLVAGAPGVGKTTLVNELRPLVTARRGWFISGKFDQYRRDQDTDAVRQATRMLIRLLLAEPESEIEGLRGRLLEALEPNASLVAAVIPELQTLLGVQPSTADGDPLKIEDRLFQGGLALFRTVVSPTRPLVMVIDDLQWGTQTPLAFFNTALMEENLRGLLLVGAYREAEVDATHPLAAMLSGWSRLDTPPPILRLQNLPPADLKTLLQEMLRLPSDEAVRFAAAIGERSGGNPYDTVELVNALRRDGALVPGPDGWTWDETTIHRYIGQGDVVDHLSARIENLPPETRAVIEVMACLGGEVESGLLRASTGHSTETLEEELEPALDDGLVTVEQTGISKVEGIIRFRHDRVQQAAHGLLDASRQSTLHLSLARRLAMQPAYATVAAEQYLASVQGVQSEQERRQAVELFRVGAANARPINFAAAERFLLAATELLRPIATPADTPLLASLQAERHVALYNLNRFEEADELYQVIKQQSASAERFEAACIQICSLTNRNQPENAVALGLEVLTELGIVLPSGETLGVEIHKGLERLHHWVVVVDEASDLQRPQVHDPRVMAAARIINRMMPPAFFCNQTVMAWLVIQCHRLWVEYGPCAPLVGPLCHAPYVTIGATENYEIAYRIAKHVLAVSEAHGYEPDTSQSRFLFALGTCHWFEPAEESVRQARQAREGLVRNGDLQNACFTFYASIPAYFECAASAETYLMEIEAGIDFAGRTGNNQSRASFSGYYQMMMPLISETATPDSFGDSAFDEVEHLEGMAGNPTAVTNFHMNRALAATLLGNMPVVRVQLDMAASVLVSAPATFLIRWYRLLRALELAERLKTAPPDQKNGLLEEFETQRAWLATRAAEAPANFLHLLRFVEAERAWATGDSWAAASAFDAALREVTPKRLPWHQALIAERAGLFHLDRGLEHTGRSLLAEARDLYSQWGARSKVRLLERQHFFLRGRGGSVSSRDLKGTKELPADSIDLLTIVRASQALSSETNLERLKTRVVELLGTMTGATTILIALREEAGSNWVLSGTARGLPLPVEEAGARGLLPLSVFRYVERTREPLVVEDAPRDNRFSGDTYFAGLGHCSLMAVPVLSRGVPRAILLLENRLSRGTFSADRLDAVLLITGQLTVSLDNAQLYASLERKVADRTDALRRSRDELEDRVIERTQQLTDANRDLLVAKEEAERANAAKSQFLSRMSHELRTPMNAVLGFGQLLEMQTLTPRQSSWVAQILNAGQHLLGLINDVLDITRTEAGEMKFSIEEVSAAELVVEAVEKVRPAAAEQNVNLESLVVSGRVKADHEKLRQALVNILDNGVRFNQPNGTVLVTCTESGDGRTYLAVTDTGVGMSGEDLKKLFTPFERLQAEKLGVEGTGLGLVIARRLIEGMGGTLTVESAVGQGSTFTIGLESA